MMQIFAADQTYAIRNRDGLVAPWRCIHANEQFAWLVNAYDHGHAAYCWMQDGRPRSLPGYVAMEAVDVLEELANSLGYTLVPFGAAA